MIKTRKNKGRKIGKLCFIKTAHFCSLKIIIKRVDIRLQARGKVLQCISNHVKHVQRTSTDKNRNLIKNQKNLNSLQRKLYKWPMNT